MGHADSDTSEPPLNASPGVPAPPAVPPPALCLPLLPIRDDTPFIMMPARADNEEVRRSVAAEDAAAPPKSGVAAALPTESRMEAASLDSLPSRERWPGALPGNAGGPGEAGTLFLAGFGEGGFPSSPPPGPSL